MRRWIEPEAAEVSAELRQGVGGHPLVAETLALRGFSDLQAARAFLDPDLYHPSPPEELPGVLQAAERIEAAIRRGERVCVWGDFDVDGQTATTVLVSCLEALGANLAYHIPNRERESHGVSIPVLRSLIDDGMDLLLTCDTGVSAREAVEYAQSRLVDVVITDHHELPDVLPEAYALVNPKLLPGGHPLRELPGVGAAYKLAEALHERARSAADADQYLDLVALGIVADVATQTGDTRYLLQRGLAALRRTQRLGLQTMMELADLRLEWLTEEHIGFVLAPRLNALGRLADANPAVEFFRTADPVRGRTLASELEGLNAQRTLLTAQVTQAAEAQIERDPSLLEFAALVLSHPTWPPGIIGIVAGRLAERYNRPVVLISSPSEMPARGSARSVEGCNITEAIGAHRDMLSGFGGHAMAAGLSLDAERIPEFRRALSRTVSQMLGEREAEASLEISGYLSLGDISLDLVQDLERLAPFGRGNPPLTLATRRLALMSHSTVGRGGEHVQLLVEDEEGASQRVIWWQGGGHLPPEGRFDLAYTLRATDYRGQRDVQVEWVDARPVEEPAIELVAEPTIELVDHRLVLNPERLLQRLRSEEGDVQVWSEAQHKSDVEGVDRLHLTPSDTLVIWTTPPGPAELRAALATVSPRKLVLFGVDPGLDAPRDFLARLAGLVKHALAAAQGRVRISALAAATAHRPATARAGLDWLASRGNIRIEQGDGDELRLVPGTGDASASASNAEKRLRALLEETVAYRSHFARADADELIADQSV